MTEADIHAIREAIAEKIHDHLDANFSDALKKAGKSDDEVTEELRKVRRTVEAITCQELCAKVYAGNPVAIANCQANCGAPGT